MLRRAVDAQPTFPEVGASRAVAIDGAGLPAGYHHLRLRSRVARGEPGLQAAAAAVMSWQMHRGSGIRVVATAPWAAVGETVVCGIGFGPLRLTAPCRVVWTVDEPRRRGFGYATLPGHPERGEEAFLVERDADDQVWLTVLAFSRPGQVVHPAGRSHGRRAAAPGGGPLRACGSPSRRPSLDPTPGTPGRVSAQPARQCSANRTCVDS